jgi:hypothetical protein
LDPPLEGRKSNLVVFKARTEEYICKFMGKLKLLEKFCIGKGGSANNIPGMLGFQPDPPE